MSSEAAQARTPAGAWAGRPPGLPGAVPPPSVPLSFLAASGFGLLSCGLALAWAAGQAVRTPTADRVVMAAHLGMLATLSMGVLGALHQFAPVISQRPLRSVGMARGTFACWLAGSWFLPIGIGARQEAVVELGALFAASGIALAVANLSRPLSVTGKGAAVTGMRLALVGLVATALFGSLYVADRRGEWFALSGHVVLAHAIVGLLGWLGLAYVSVAEKLWPMFFLAHLPGRRRAGSVAVLAIPAGVALASPALLIRSTLLGVAAGVVIGVGLGAHLFSLAAYLRHRRRKADLHFAFVVTSAGWLGVAVLAAAGAAVAAVGHSGATAGLVAAAVAALGGWLLEALVGHAHKVVPFVLWSLLRSKGIDKNAQGRALAFSDLYGHSWAVLSYAALSISVALVVCGLAFSAAGAVAAGGVGLAVTAVVVTANLSVVPWRMLRQGKARGPAGVAVPPAAL